MPDLSVGDPDEDEGTSSSPYHNGWIDGFSWIDDAPTPSLTEDQANTAPQLAWTDLSPNGPSMAPGQFYQQDTRWVVGSSRILVLISITDNFLAQTRTGPSAQGPSSQEPIGRPAATGSRENAVNQHKLTRSSPTRHQTAFIDPGAAHRHEAGGGRGAPAVLLLRRSFRIIQTVTLLKFLAYHDEFYRPPKLNFKSL